MRKRSDDWRDADISHHLESERRTENDAGIAACEIVGVHAKSWDIFAVKVARGGSVTIGHKPVYNWQPLTRNGNSNKESDWFLPPSK